MNTHKGFAFLPLIIMIAAVLAVGTVGYFAIKKPAAETNANSSENLSVLINNTNLSDQNSNITVLNTNEISNVDTRVNANTETSLAGKVTIQVAKTPSVVLDQVEVIANYPLDIRPEQLDGVFTFSTGLKFGKVNYRSLKTDTRSNITWGGLIVSLNSGKSWQKFFTLYVADRLEAQSDVAGIYVKGGKLYIDVVDNRGAGSGEGNMQRLISSDGGDSWKKSGCYYFVNGQYYEPDTYNPLSSEPQPQQLTPNNIQTTSTNCEYSL